MIRSEQGVRDTVFRKESAGTSLYEALKQKIMNGELRPGDQLASLRVLHGDFGISYRAALQAMERLETEGYIERQQGAGTFVRDREPDRAARTTISAYATFSTFTRMDKRRESFQRPLLTSLSEGLQKEGFSSAVRIVTEEAAAVRMEEDPAEVCIWMVAPSGSCVFPKKPVVLLGHDLDQYWAPDSSLDVVASDARQGAILVGRHLREIGCVRPVFVGAPEPDLAEDLSLSIARLRYAAFQLGWGASLPESSFVLAARYTPAAGAKTVQVILKENPRPDAVFCASDDLALGFCHALLSHGITPGREIKVVGFDGQPPIFPDDPKLTSVEAPLVALGRAAVQAAMSRCADPGGPARRILLTGSLRKGETA